MLFVPASISTTLAQDSEIPAWIKNNAGWWATDQIDDSSFLQGIQYLIKEGIMVIPSTETTGSSGSSGSEGVPAWVKNNAGWWADGQIDDNAFISGIQYLIKSGIIVVEQEQAQPTQPTVTDNEIQKLADEYLDCFMGERVTSSCIAWDEDKHAIGGIEELTYISGYQVFDGCPGCDWRNDYHNPVDAELEKFQDEDLHKQLFDIFVSIAPKQILDDVVFLYISTDGYGGKEAASIGRDMDYPLKFWLNIDPLDMAPSAGPIDRATMKVVMIHESAHILSLSSSQGDNDAIPGDLYEEPYTELRELFQEKTSACANYYSDVPGCMKDNSYMNKFFQEFWVDIYPSFKWSHEFDDYDKFLDHNVLFYKKYKTQFVTDYAATNPDEDFAESYMLFVLKEKPTKSTIADQKILFFYDFPELVEMRDLIRSNL